MTAARLSAARAASPDHESTNEGLEGAGATDDTRRKYASYVSPIWLAVFGVGPVVPNKQCNDASSIVV